MKPLTIGSLVRQAYSTAEKKGWHEKPRSSLEIAALLHSEVSEFVEEMRRNTPLDLVGSEPDGKPIGPQIELADILIRIADYCGSEHLDLERALRAKLKYNKTRPYRHGGKRY